MQPYIASQTARDHHQDQLSRAARERFVRQGDKERTPPQIHRALRNRRTWKPARLPGMSWASRAAAFVALLVGVAACTGSPSPGHVTPALKFSSTAAALVHVGTSASVPIRVSDPGATISESGALPSGMSFRAGRGGTAAIAGVPQGDAGGAYQIRLTADDGTRHVRQELRLSVDEAPYFPSIDNATFGANEYHGNQDVIVATGYPMPQLSYTGTLPGGFTFTQASTGMVTVSGSPGSFEGPCSSQITLRAVSASGTATLPMTIKLGDWRCPLNVAGPLLGQIAGGTIIGKAGKAGKAVGEWLWQNGKKAAAWVWERGRAVVVSPEAEQGAPSVAEAA
jgi:Putative Ig domain